MNPLYVKRSLYAFAALAAIALLDALFFEKYFFQIKRFGIGKKNSNRQIKILLLTDLHFVKRLWPFHKRLAKKINALHPDLILIAGDIISENGEAPPARQFFGLLKTAIPKLAIPGNHDHKNKVSRGTLKKILQRCKGRLLVNETQQLMIAGTPFTITGVDDFIEGEGCFADAVRNIGREEHHLLLVHSPLQQETVQRKLHSINQHRPGDRQIDIQYIFAGHNHGGQVRLGPIVPVLPEESGNYVNGWYNKEKPYLYVSKGFGTSCVPFRFGARPEITLFYYGV